jgi:phosphonate transport system permease protein
VPDLIWALLLVTAVGLGPLPGVLALSVHSIGMLGRLFAGTIEDIDMGPVQALSITGANRLQIGSQAVFPGLLPSLIGISPYRLNENARSPLVLGFVGAGGIGFLILTATNLFQYRQVSTLLIPPDHAVGRPRAAWPPVIRSGVSATSTTVARARA